MKKFVIDIHADHIHQLTVGVVAEDAVIAQNLVTQAYADGSVWDNSLTMPILYDEAYDADKPRLTVSEPKEVDQFPAPDDTVLAGQRREKAFAACRALLAGDYTSALDMAYQAIPSLTSSPDHAITSIDLLALAQKHVVEASLALAGGFRSTHIISMDEKGVVYDEGCDGETVQVSVEAFLDTYPVMKGRIWRIEQLTPQ